MSPLKLAALQLGFHAGLFGLARFALRRRQAVILTFHRFSGNGEGHRGGLPINKFAQDMRYLTRHYRVVSLRDLSEELQNDAVQPYTVAVTVDDGYHEVFTLAAPILKRYGVPASFFVVSDFIEGRLWLWTDRFDWVFDRASRNRAEFFHRGSVHHLDLRETADRQRAQEQWVKYAKRLPVSERDELLEAIAQAAGVEVPVAPPTGYRPMTWAQLRALAADGFDVGAHTRTHPILSRVDPRQLRVEVEGCKEQMEQRLGCRVRHLAYPNGRREDYSAEAVAAAARAGYVAAVTTVQGANTSLTPLLELHRIGARPEHLARFAQSLSGFEELRRRAQFRSDRRPAPALAGGPMAHAGERE